MMTEAIPSNRLNKKLWVLAAVGCGLLIVVGIVFWRLKWSGGQLLNPFNNAEEVSVPEPEYLKYSFNRLALAGGVKSAIEREGEIFYYLSEGRRISGQSFRAQGQEKGIVVLARGYVDKEDYQTGTGTKNAAAYFAENGYTTYAPDFSGYGMSDKEDENALGARLVKPVEILDLIASVNDGVTPIFLWGHSNGGQIMLSVAEIIGKGELFPMVKGVTLWAPVSKPFPYNILYYTDEADDKGKWLRREIAEFEKIYDVYDYSIDRYWDSIKIPLQIHQGSADEAVPVRWSRELKEALEVAKVEATYSEYPGADHNLRPVWDMVVERDLRWFDTLK